MKFDTFFKNRLRFSRSPFSLLSKSLILSVLILSGIQATLLAQQYTQPTWWFGVAEAANLNFYRGSIQELNSGLTVPTTFHDGYGRGLFIAPLVEFHSPNSIWGMMFQAGYDNRKGTFEAVTTPCNCPADLSTKITYITLEPSVRLAPFKSGFYLYAGPRLAFNLAKSFAYKLGINPTYPEQEVTPAVEGDLSNMNNILFSMQIGVGYDIPLSSRYSKTKLVISPFVSFHPYFGQSPRSIETWNLTTLRIGAALKIGTGSKISAPPDFEVIEIQDSEVQFSVYSPRNIPVERNVRETFPICNYVYFNLGSDEIPDRYVLLTKDQAKDFREDNMEVFAPNRKPLRSERQLLAYYHILNILGSRMQNAPKSTIVLVGASEKGPEGGKLMAESIKSYLVNTFGINASRISIEGRFRPKVPSGLANTTTEVDILAEANRRVTIESSSPDLLMEFQSGSTTLLKPVVILALQQAPIDSYVSFNVAGVKKGFSTWSLEITDSEGKVQYYGPYTEEKISIPGKSFLGNRPEGDFMVKMIGKTKTGNTVIKETPVHMVLWTPMKDKEATRYSIIFEYNKSKALSIYKNYLTDVVAPTIPIGGKVFIHGHTDVIGSDVGNKTLSFARANEVKHIIEQALLKAGRTDVTFDVYGFGEDINLMPFENGLPEERAYNRTVIIDIIPKN